MTFRSALPVLLLLLLAAGVAAFVRSAPADPPPLPAIALAGDVTLLHARPFTLDKPFTHVWRKEQPQFSSGWVLVLSVNPELVHPRQSAEPILFAGDQTAERVNFGDESGHVVAIVPSELDATGRPALDLSRTLLYFGAPGLPEQVDAARAGAELAAARKRGLQPPTRTVLEATVQPAVHFADDDELHLYCSDLIEHYSPQETDLVSGLRAPRLSR
jgi:hypothetical protein